MSNPLAKNTPEEFFAITDVRILDDFTRMFRDTVYAPLNVKYYDEFLSRTPDDDRGRMVSQTKLLVLEDILHKLAQTRKKILREAQLDKG